MADQNYEGFIDFGGETEDVHEQQPVPTGSYDLTIQSAKGVYAEKEDGSGQYLKKVNVQIDIEGQANAATLFHTITLPQASEKAENPKKWNFKVVLVKKFFKLFNVNMGQSGINTTDLIGAKASQALVELTSYDKGDGTPPKPSNKLNLDNVKV